MKWIISIPMYHQLSNSGLSGALLGMQSLDNALRGLLDAQLITPPEAYQRAVHKQAFAALQGHEVSA